MDSFVDQVESKVDVVYVELRLEQTKEHCCGNIAFSTVYQSFLFYITIPIIVSRKQICFAASKKIQKHFSSTSYIS